MGSYSLVPSTQLVPMERAGRRPERTMKRNSRSCAARAAPGAAPAPPRWDCSIMSDESLKESSEPNPDEFIQHCFKRFKYREKHPNAFMKLKPSRFGPAAPRRRILIAPPMQGTSLPSARLLSPEPVGQKQETFPAKEHLKEVAKIPTEGDEMKELSAWIEERKKLQNLLNKCEDVESWLLGKESHSEQEASILRKIREPREVKKAQMKVQLTAASSVEPLSAKKPKKTLPLIAAPYPESLITLQNLLRDHKSRLVDIFNKEDRTKTMKFKRADFIRIIERTKVPISKNDLEDAVIYLTSTKKGNYITNSDLVECQKIWLEYLREQWRQTKEAKPGGVGERVCPPANQKVGLMTPKRLQSSCSKSKLGPSQKAKSNYLEVPPINTEPDRMHLSYTKMEEVGKRYREVRRRLKRKTNPLEWAEKCRVVKTGDQAVDGHCMMSTIEGDMGELVDHHRMACHLVWFQCVKLCEQYGVPLSEKLLKRALLYPGDKLLNYKGTRQKLRQPGGYYEAYKQQESSSSSRSRSRSKSREKSKSPPKEKRRARQRRMEERVPQEKSMRGRWRSYREFRNLMRGHSKRLRLAAQNLLNEKSCRKLTEQSQREFKNLFMERELRKMFDFLNPKTDANSFWPGHLLDKLRLYLPQMEHDEGEALFSHVSRTRPAYSSTYHPNRSWPISEQTFVTYGDPDSRKDYYYI
uniref:EF-hand calcium-binding domain-containing protein 12 n=1 Tax=Euleptes europaea TaxID=460621 RepID=UPI0025421E57|nr:EF-hand calcium-binding domain-containing protein 12 [Euleptes europaea]